MAYCEIVTQIGNANEPLMVCGEVQRNNTPTNLTEILVLGIIEGVVDRACSFAEGKSGRDLPGDKRETLLPKKESVESSKIGLGDGLSDGQTVRPALSTLEIPTEKLPPVEKKSRLTDLVKNSKQVLSKLILNESLKNAPCSSTSTKWEEKDEELLNSVDLDEVKPNEVPYKSAVNNNRNCSARLEAVDLGGVNKTKTNTFPAAASGSRSLRSRFSTMKVTSKEFAAKKKWSFGSKVWSYLRRRNSATKTKRADKVEGATPPRK